MSNRERIHYFRRMFQYMEGRLFPYMFSMFMYSVQGFAFTWIMANFVQGIMSAILLGEIQALWDWSFFVMWQVIGFMLLLALSVYITYVMVGYTTRKVSMGLFRAYVNQNLETRQSGHSGEGIAALRTELEMATGLYDNAIHGVLMAGLSIVFGALAIFVIDWRLGLGAVVLGAFGYVIQMKIGKPLEAIGEQRIKDNAEAVKQVGDFFAGAVPLRIFQLGDKTVKNFETPIGNIRLLDLKANLIAMWQDLFSTVQGWLSLLLTFGLGGYLVTINALTLPVLLMVPPLMMGISQAMGRIGMLVAGAKPAFVAAKRVIDIIDADVAGKRDAYPDRETKGHGITINGLNFSYKDQEGLALKNIQLTIPENKLVAFVGESGSGKSTLLRMLIGMYDREDFNMTIGEDGAFNQMSLKNWRQQFAYVDQSYKLFDLSIKENIALGRGGAGATDEAIEAAAKKAQAHGFITEQADGYDTLCGETGGSFSGGQKQRIAIARAILKDAPILVFDEATSALDPESEQGIMESIKALKGSHTILMTTHNLAQLEAADMVVRMDQGEIVEVIYQ